MRFFLLLFLLLLPLFGREVSYGPFIDKQIKLTLQLGRSDITDEEIERIIEEKERLFEQKIEEVLANKSSYLHYSDPYASKIYKLKKIIAVNKRRGNDYAVLRDEVLIKSYRILQSQNRMLKEILQALDLKSFDEFSNAVNEIFAQSQREINHINNVDYRPYLEITGEARVIKELKQRIREYYAIIEINAELLKTIVESERKMYRLNKYYRYGLIRPVLYINHTALSETLEPVLERFNLSTVKLILIVLIIFMMILLQKLLVKLFTKIFENLKFKHYLVKKIIRGITKPVEVLSLTIGINLIFYIYNDFSRVAFFSALFDMIYVIVVMYSVYKALNIIATAKIHSLAKRSTQVKSELINISIKIINFTIVLITLLIILHLAGVNLTAILSGLGIGGFAIALAAKDSLANFFGTLSILMSDTFSQGDWIVVDDKEGVVVEIGLRVTTIRTFDNALISIPNSKLANEAIKNWSKRKVGRRIKFTVGVRYDSDKKALHKALQEIREFLASHEGIAKQSSTKSIQSYFDSAKLVSKNDALGIKNFQLVTLDALAESSINIMVYCFTTTTEWGEWARIKDEVIFGVMEIIESNGLAFAFPSLSLYHEDELTVQLDTAALPASPAKVQQS